MYIVTISRQTGSLGDEIAKLLAKRLGVKLISKDYVLKNWLNDVATKHDIHMLKQSSKYYLKESKIGTTFAEIIENKLKEISHKSSIIVLELGSQIIFRNYPNAIHIRIVASKNIRIKRLINKYSLTEAQSKRTIELHDRKHRQYVNKIYGRDWSDPSLYHLCINTDGISIENALKLIMHLVDLQKESPMSLIQTTRVDVKKHEHTKNLEFAHPSEIEFAKILDMHHIEWEYEPTEFPLEWDEEGNITLSFRPDFYLPEYDTYIELTTMDQKYVTEKNKKVRLLKELYPNIKIKIVYKKDYNSISERFGFSHQKDKGGK